MSGVLAGVKVVEFSQNVAVPFCGRLLAGMGAEVVKVEPPGGDAMRHLAQLAPGEGKAYAVVNPGKRSVVIDLAADGARTKIDALFAWADVALLGFKQTDLARYGLHWDHARTVNPALVYMAATGFGPDGPDADQGGYDVLAQAQSGIGFMMNRIENDVPIATRPSFIDLGTGITSALGVVAALRHRDATGEGQRVDTSLLGTALALGTTLISYFEEADEPQVSQLRADMTALEAAGADFRTLRGVYEDRVMVASGAFRLYFRHYATADGMVSIAGISPGLFDKFHRITGLPVADRTDPLGAEFAATVHQAEELFRTRTTDDWLGIFREAGYPAAPYHSPYEAVDHVQARTNDYVVDIDHPVFGRYSTVGQPIRFSATTGPPLGPSPGLGEHTDEVFSELGLDPG